MADEASGDRRTPSGPGHGLDATFVVATAVIVSVVRGDLQPFCMIIDPDNLHPTVTAH